MLVEDKKVINAWTLYDWANSVYPLVITTAIFPLYYKSVVGNNALVFGYNFDSVEIYSYAIALSLLVVSFLSPLLSGIADFIGNKKVFMKSFNYVGATSCIGLFLWKELPIELGLLFCVTANIGFWGSLVFYNAYLPEIAHPKNHDLISAKGFSRGYFGSAILLVFCLFSIMVLDWSPKYSFLFAGIWWIGFAQITYKYLPVKSSKIALTDRKVLIHGYRELSTVWIEFSTIKRLKRYLLSFFVFSMALQTIMTMAQFFGTEAVDWSIGLDFSSLPAIDYENLKAEMIQSRMQTGMITSILFIQIIAIPGAMLFAWLSNKMGNINVLIIALLFWIFLCLSAYFVKAPTHFYFLAASVGFVMGGIQSLSRSTYSKFLPSTDDHASYFSFYDVLEKVGMTIGILSFGYLTGNFNIRYSIMALTIFFVIGLILLLIVPRKKV
ncbi:MAG: MFS transporter [Flavobacteriales bacterium]|nr:MFS transporter [Flavobacteriales bacterium]